MMEPRPPSPSQPSLQVPSQAPSQAPAPTSAPTSPPSSGPSGPGAQATTVPSTAGSEGAAVITPRAVRFVPWALGCGVAALLLLLLVQARAFLVPLVLALLLTSLASALVDRLRGVRWAGRAMPYWAASVLAVLVVGVVLTALYSVLAAQVNDLVVQAPAFIAQTQTVLLAWAGHISDDLAEALQAALQSFDPTQWLRLAAGSAGQLLSTLGLVLLYVGFLLAEWPWLDGKLTHLLPDAERRARVERNLRSIRRNIHQYLLLKTVISAATGAVVYAVAWVFGLQFALAIGLLVFVLNFIPVLGSLVGTALPVWVALVQFDSLPMVLGVLACVGTVQFVLGSIVDPMVTGQGLQMSSLAIVVALTFWSAVWGTVGMFLAVPMVVVIMIVCAQVPVLRPLAIVLSKTGELPPAYA